MSLSSSKQNGTNLRLCFLPSCEAAVAQVCKKTWGINKEFFCTLRKNAELLLCVTQTVFVTRLFLHWQAAEGMAVENFSFEIKIKPPLCVYFLQSRRVEIWKTAPGLHSNKTTVSCFRSCLKSWYPIHATCALAPTETPEWWMWQHILLLSQPTLKFCYLPPSTVGGWYDTVSTS